MKYQSQSYFIAGILGALTLSGCGSDEGPGNLTVGPGHTGISQGGAQDFGLFRQILEDGEIPGPETLEDIGFFAEHKLDYPAPACGEDVCMHGLLGIMGNMISGSTCTLIQIGMNSPIDISTVQRPDLHLVIAADTSASMVGAPMTYMKAGLAEMIPTLQPNDRITLVTYAASAKVIAEAVPASDQATLQAAIDSLDASGATNSYDGLFTAFALADKHYDPSIQNRVLFLSDGEATTGVTNPAKMKSLAEGYARKGIGITTVGIGNAFDVEVLRDLSEVGAGNFYFVEDPVAVKEVFTDEVKTFLVPVALDVHIDIAVSSGYVVRGAYGTKGWEGGEGGGTIDIPSLFLAGRTSADDPINTGRRGGGGAILLELVPAGDQTGVVDPFAVGNLALSWTHAASGTPKTEQVNIQAPNAPDDPPVNGYFSGATVEKGFVMLNLYAGFKLAAQLAADSDPRTARRTLETLRPNVDAWLADNPDPDIEDDLRYVDLFLANLAVVEANVQPYTPADPPNPWPAD